MIYRAFICLAVAYWLVALGILIFRNYNMSFFLALKLRIQHSADIKALIRNSTIFTIVVLGFMVWNFLYNIDNREKENYPAVLFCIIMSCAALLPFNVISRSARWELLKILLNIISAPFGKVDFVHALVGDLLTSLTRIFIDFANTICWISNGSWKTSAPVYCFSFDILNVLTVLPMFWRFFMCVREAYEVKSWIPFFNAIKYILIVSLGMVVFLRYDHLEGFSMVDVWCIIFCGFVTCYNLYWDFKQDQGLFEKGGYKFLRKELTYPVPFYYMSMVINIILRCNWLVLFLPDNYVAKYFHNINWLVLYASVCELVRRFIWALIRVENELIKHPEIYGDMGEIPPVYLLNK